MDNSNNIQTQNQQQFYPMPRIGDQAPATRPPLSRP